jgi:hypothetical protein
MDDVPRLTAGPGAEGGYWQFIDPITGGECRASGASTPVRGADLEGDRFRASLSDPHFTKDQAAASAPVAQGPAPAGLEVIVPQGDVSPIGPRPDWPAFAPPPAPPSLLAAHALFDEPAPRRRDSRVLAEIFARLESRPD